MSRFKGKLFRGAMVLSGTQAVGQVCSLGRNIIVARLISPADFGVAAIFLMTVNLMDMISNMSLDRLLVQAEDGDEEAFQQTAQGLNLVRGAISALIIVLLAIPLSSLFNIPEAVSAFVVLGIVPLLIGLSHLDPKRLERHMKYWPNASVEVSSQAILLVAAWPLASYFCDYRAMLWLLVLRSFVLLAGSHFVAKRVFRIGWRKDYLQRFFHFGWPLLLNGMLLFLVLQGDRFLLGSAQKLFGSNYDMADVGVYSAAFLLAMVPGQMLARVGISLFLPSLSREQDNPDTFNHQYRRYLASYVLLGVVFGAGFILCGEQSVDLIYGNEYAAAGSLVGWLGIMWVVRILRVVPTLVSMAKGQTKNLLPSNVFRTLALIPILVLVAQEADLAWIAISGIAGELVALVIMVRMNRIAFPLCRLISIDLLSLSAAALVLTLFFSMSALLPLTGVHSLLSGLLVSFILALVSGYIIQKFMGVTFVMFSRVSSGN
ncbi:oligosaccharide flippase family protein [Deltaproteobacteria bacterium IMCC39524]|nr:oligosaccharide flippase family protein [Deltaproteobacteria bacterium IMCC39524]